MTLIEQLEYDIPRAEERLGSDARIVRQMRRQLEGIKAESRLGDQLVFNVSATKVESQNKRNLRNTAVQSLLWAGAQNPPKHHRQIFPRTLVPKRKNRSPAEKIIEARTLPYSTSRSAQLEAVPEYLPQESSTVPLSIMRPAYAPYLSVKFPFRKTQPS